eukprot:CAMPEP_0185025550 /NCGR_PEP_ID=MMETSP1103-20130426/8462_1 /TAXON_ID=36769 /ORGANISM="Paraphysomonas bandaiensis, Strain Caron Lab Isolate" /LENGTH=240 /DNA_ID=CAMNT_0027558771 /DNA_START=52 /DNA_END=771 /DNA_ORIENTATION=+
MGGDNFQKLSPVENTVVGVCIGVIEVTLMQPTLYLKNAAQQNLPFTIDPRKLYRGLAVSIGNMSVLTGLQFPLTGIVTNVITGGQNRKLSASEQISSGFAGGALSGFACAPMELVLIQQQRFGGSLLSTPHRIVTSFGPMTMFRGLLTACGREGVFTAGYMGVGPVISNYMEHERNMSNMNAKAVGAVVAGVLASTLSHPMDTIKSCMQGDLERKTYTSLVSTTRLLLAEGGPRRFFSGW